MEVCDYPFMLLEKGAKAEISEIFERLNISPKVHFTTCDDYAIMSMVENGLGISILPELIYNAFLIKLHRKNLSFLVIEIFASLWESKNYFLL